MPNAEDIRWFKQQFGRAIEDEVRGTPFVLDLLTAVACQETGYIWQALRKQQLSLERLLELCVGDTLDVSGGRRAFPKSKADLLAKANGEQMFAIARQALVDMSQYIRDYQRAAEKPNKFCHGFGIFQYDLQFFLKDPDYFLQKSYADFSTCLEKCIEELSAAMLRVPWQHETTLTDYQLACVAIAYNTGGFRPAKGLKQGYFDGRKYYGESVFEFLRVSKTVALDGGFAPLPAPTPGQAIVAQPTPVDATGPFYEVDVRETLLRLRREPKIDASDPTANVIAKLPDGQVVRAVTNKKIGGFLEVETSLSGAFYRGFAHTKYLKPAPAIGAVSVAGPTPALPTSGIPAVYMPRKQNTVTKRTEIAGPHSLNEPNQPGRRGTTAGELRAELAAIIDWLAVDDPEHLRYKPHDRLTFCNIYVHDYCHLAGVYIPRVWWTPTAIEALALGQDAQLLYGKTIDEQRANDLFRWLRDFGLRFGWRQTGTLSKLQLEVNQGAIGLIVARRKEDGLSGHIVSVVPETEIHRARRNAVGEVVAPLQSQAGVTNFLYGTGKVGWWEDERFAEGALWLHA